MAYRDGDRYQMTLLPPVIDDYVGPEDPVRAYDAIIEAMGMEGLGLVIDSNKVGNPAYDPKSMLKLMVYGYSYGWRSSRKLERALHHNLSFIWLMGGLKPDHKTIANFRKDNKAVLQGVLKQCARICLKLNLIEGNCLFTDGTKTRGNASINQTRTRGRWERKLAEVDQRIEELLIECDEIDEKNGMIVSADVVNDSNDSKQFSNQIGQAVKTLGKPCQTAVADAGYTNVDNIKETTDKNVDVIVPSQRQSLHKIDDNPYGKDKFQYDLQNNSYICPEGHKLRYSHYSTKKGHYIYHRIEKASLCRECPHYGVCTDAKRGRTMIRLRNEELREKLETRYASEEGQAIYRKRKGKVEIPFGHIKRNLNGGAFLVRGLPAVKAEFSILASCFNIARMITLTGGVSGLINRLAIQGT